MRVPFVLATLLPSPRCSALDHRSAAAEATHRTMRTRASERALASVPPRSAFAKRRGRTGQFAQQARTVNAPALHLPHVVCLTGAVEHQRDVEIETTRRRVAVWSPGTSVPCGNRILPDFATSRPSLLDFHITAADVK